MAALSTAGIAALSSDQLVALTTAQYAALGADQAAAIETVDVCSLSVQFVAPGIDRASKQSPGRRSAEPEDVTVNGH